MMTEQMKPSGIAWIGDIPEDWKIGRVKDFYKLQTGFTPDTSMAEYYDDENGELWVSIADIETKHIANTKSKISQLYIREKRPGISPKDSLLYSFKLSVGKVGFIDTDMYTNEAIASFYPQRACLPFLYYSSLFIEENANRNIYGAKILNQDLVKNAYIIYPPLPEQQVIADYLDAQCAKIDSIAADLEKQIELLQKYKKSLITETVTKGLDKTAPMKDSGIEWIGEIPEKWEVEPLKYLFSLYAGGDIDEYDFSDEKTEKYQYPIYSNSLENDGLYGYTSKYRFAGNTFTVTGRGDVGKAVPRSCAYYPVIRLLACISKNDSNNRYYSYCVNSADILGDQTAMAQLTTQKLGIIKVPVPCVLEQIEIANYLDEKCLKTDSIIEEKTKQLETIQQHKKSLIYEYVTGKKRVKEVQ